MKRFILLALILTACAEFQQTKMPAMPDIFVGTEALDAKFGTGSISNIFMCGQSNLWVELQNKGAFDIKDGKYSFIIEDQVMGTENKPSTFSLTGKSKVNPVGGVSQIDFTLKNKGLPKQLESYITPVVFQACYKYQTSASALVCIDPRVSSLNVVKACTPQEVGLGVGQGAPVAVTRVVPTMLIVDNTVTPAFRIFVQHVGTGQVVTEKGVDVACNLNFKETQDVKSLISEVKLKAEAQGEKLTCGPENKNEVNVRLGAGTESEVLCKMKPVSDQAAFTTPVFIELSYGYVTTAVFPIAVTRMQGQSNCQ